MEKTDDNAVFPSANKKKLIRESIRGTTIELPSTIAYADDFQTFQTISTFFLSKTKICLFVGKGRESGKFVCHPSGQKIQIALRELNPWTRKQKMGKITNARVPKSTSLLKTCCPECADEERKREKKLCNKSKELYGKASVLLLSLTFTSTCIHVMRRCSLLSG